jgi:hypothetical protein
MFMANLDVCPNESVTFRPSFVKLNVTRSSGEKYAAGILLRPVPADGINVIRKDGETTIPLRCAGTLAGQTTLIAIAEK